MGQKLVDAFQNEIGKIKTEKMKKMAIGVLQECNDANAVGAASASGKYHPEHDLGEGGLVRHTKCVCINAETLLSSMPYYDDPVKWDRVYVAALLHDMCKFLNDDLSHSNGAHPVDCAALISYYNSMFGGDDTDIEQCAKNVACHMSRWNQVMDYSTKPATVKDTMPTPANLEESLVSFADLIASKKYFHVNFDENGEIIA